METEEILAAIQKAADTIAKPNYVDKLSLLVSVLAIVVAAFVALHVAKKQNEITKKQNEIAFKQAELADQQNRISLFKERYELYQLVKKCMNVAGFLESYQYHNLNEFYKYVFFCFDEIIMENQNNGKDRVIYAMRDIADRLHQSEFLFSFEVCAHVQLLAERFRSFIFLEDINQSSKEFQEAREQYCKTASMLVSNETLTKMKSELKPILTR